MTAADDHVRVHKSALAVVFGLLLASAAFAASARATGIGSLPPGWSHVQVNVVIKHQAHTVSYDRGRVQAVGTRLC